MVSVSGCNPEMAGGGEFKEVTVDRHVFHVPERYLVKGSIPWLPQSQHEGLSFVINPEAQPQEQKIVGINSAQTTCSPKTPPTSSILGSACSSLRENSGVDHTEEFSPEKIYPNDGITFQWEYRLRNPDGSYRSVADCTSVKGGQDGICHSLASYEDLVYSVSLRDSEIRSLPKIWAKVRDLLATWEKKPVASE